MFLRNFFLLLFSVSLGAVDSQNVEPIVDETSANYPSDKNLTAEELYNFVLEQDKKTSIFRSARSYSPSLEYLGMSLFLATALTVDIFKQIKDYCPRTMYDSGYADHGWMDAAPPFGLPYLFHCIAVPPLEAGAAALAAFMPLYAGSVLMKKIHYYLDKRMLSKRLPGSLATDEDLKNLGKDLVDAQSPLLRKLNPVQLTQLFFVRENLSGPPMHNFNPSWAFLEMENLFDKGLLPSPVAKTLFSMAKMKTKELETALDAAILQGDLEKKFGHVDYFCNMLWVLLWQQDSSVNRSGIKTRLIALKKNLRNPQIIRNLVEMSKIMRLYDLRNALSNEKIVDGCNDVKAFCDILRLLLPADIVGGIEDRLIELEKKQ